MVNFTFGRLISGQLFSRNGVGCQVLRDTISIGRRTFFGWLNSIFNKYDESRVKEVGPDRAAAEWLIRCGAGVKWEKNADWFRDYNALPATYDRSLKIVEVDGTDSAVMNIGFRHLYGLNIKKIIFHKAGYIDDYCLNELSKYLTNTLTDLQVSSCGNVSSAGILTLCNLRNLENLLLYDLPEIKNRVECIEALRKALPRCKVDFPYAQASEKA